MRASVVRLGQPPRQVATRSPARGPRRAAMAYEQAGIGPDELSCVEVHDASAPAELMIYEQIGLPRPAAGRSCWPRAARGWTATCR